MPQQPATPDSDIVIPEKPYAGGGGAKAAAASSPSSTARSDTSGPSNRVNVGDDDEMQLVGFAPSKPRIMIAILAVVFSAGLAALVFYWKKVSRADENAEKGCHHKGIFKCFTYAKKDIITK